MAECLILGAGVGGLTLAVKLAQHGKACLVVEKDELAMDSGAGLLRAPNDARVLQRTGLLSPICELGHVTQRWRILDQQGGVLRDLKINAGGLPAISIQRAGLLAFLRAGCDDVRGWLASEWFACYSERSAVIGLTAAARAAGR